MRQTIKLKARAKINLSIDVLNKRNDGFHNVSMIMQAIDLFDEIEIVGNISSESKINIKSQGVEIPTDQSNIMWQAVKEAEIATEKCFDVDINIIKKIPTQAGLGGGSADGAAVVFAINELCNAQLSEKRLLNICAVLGSDVSFMLRGGTAMAEGRGEILTPVVPGMPQIYVVLVKPNFGISTALAYKKIGQTQIKHPDILAMKAAIQQGEPLTKIAKYADNVIEQAVKTDYPMIETIKSEIKDLGAILTMLSGSGSTVFGLFDDYEIVNRAFQKLQEKKDRWCCLTQTSSSGIELL